MQIGVTFGALAKPLRHQLKGKGLDSYTLTSFQRDADAVTRLAIRGVLTDEQIHDARRKLLKQIIRAIPK